MSTDVAFYPQGTVNIAATTTSANVVLPVGRLTIFQMGEGDSVLVYNSTAAIAFVEFGGDNTVAASVLTSLPIPPGFSRMLGVGSVATYAAAMLSTGTGVVYFSRGKGHQY
jgi:hypothetical protein